MDFKSAAINLGFNESIVRKIVSTAESAFSELGFEEQNTNDEYFRENLLQLSNILNSGGIPSAQPISHIGEDLDFLSQTAKQFSFLKALNFAALACIEPIYRCAIVATARNEGPFILEWLAHHRAIGFEHFYIYTNDNTDGSTDLLKRLAENGIIKLILNEVTQTANPQVKSYEHSIFLMPEIHCHEWIFYLDLDEFFIPDPEGDFKIEDILATVKDKFGDELPAFIAYNWNWMGSAGAVRRTSHKVTERFQYGEAHPHVKSLVRPSKVLSMAGIHDPLVVQGGFGVNAALEPVTIKRGAVFPPCTSGSRINHYWSKSFEEFLVKQTKGEAAPGRSQWYRETELFFDWDVAVTACTQLPFPGALADRLEEELSFLIASPNISRCKAIAEEQYANLVVALCKDQSVDDLHAKGLRKNGVLKFLDTCTSPDRLNEENVFSEAEELIRIIKAGNCKV